MAYASNSMGVKPLGGGKYPLAGGPTSISSKVANRTTQHRNGMPQSSFSKKAGPGGEGYDQVSIPVKHITKLTRQA